MRYQKIKQLLADKAIGPEVATADAAAQLNAKTLSKYRVLVGRELRPLAPSHGVLSTLRDAKAGYVGPDPLTQNQVRDACDVALMLFTDREAELDLNDPAQAGLITLMVATQHNGASIIPSAARDQLYAKATVLYSEAEAEGLGEITDGDIIEARK